MGAEFPMAMGPSSTLCTVNCCKYFSLGKKDVFHSKFYLITKYLGQIKFGAGEVDVQRCSSNKCVLCIFLKITVLLCHARDSVDIDIAVAKRQRCSYTGF